MNDVEKDEFWRALGRLYDSSLNTLRAIEELRKIAETHEKRLDYSEVLLNALREEINRLKADRGNGKGDPTEPRP
jgi:hypothetical protein